MKKSKNYFANFISYLFHPLFMPSLGILFFYFSKKINGFNMYTSDAMNKDNIIVLSVTLIFLLLIPALCVYILKKLNKISSYRMPKREERILPFFLMTMSIMYAYYLLFNDLNVQVELVIRLFYIGCFLSILSALTITLQWKISIHMIGVGGFTGALFLLNYMYNSDNTTTLVVAILISGIVAYSRLKLSAHSLKQVVAGYVLGFLCQAWTMAIL